MKNLSNYLLGVILILLMAPVFADTVTQQHIEFKGKSFPVSALKQRIAKQKGLPLNPVEPDTLSAVLYKPTANKKYPAIVMVHDCRGIQNYQHNWAQRVASWGFAVLLMDSFTTRNIESTCQGLGEQENFLIHGGRVQDVFAAHDYLRKQDYVESFRIGLMGWDYHSVLGAVAKHGMQQKFDASFMGAVAIYPSCNATSGTDFISPILVLIGEQDDWTPAEECRIMERYARSGEESVQLRYYKNAMHGFDDPSLTQQTYFPDFRNYFKSPARGVTMQYNAQAHQAAIKVVRQFLDFNIKHRPIQITLDDLPSQFTSEQIQQASWINPPDEHGPTLPAKGVSLFDEVFSVNSESKWHYDIPFPFDKLLEKLSTVVGHQQDAPSPLKSVLIPSGRSLVRNAAAPDFFEFPRVVVAVDTEPPRVNNQYALMLKDRLYIGYQEKANALEVISYNNAEQRFEFQIVKDYVDGKQPRVEYANRSVCLSCHQNHAPIFANAPWDETNFNEQVFTRIKEKRQHFYGLIPAVPVASAANSIDRSTNRATFLPIYNALWQRGCQINNEQASVQCRSAAFKAMLQYRLSNKAGFERNSLHYEDRFLKTATRAWQTNWPDGLAIPAANITDRNPFTEKMEVSARFDPLTPRPPQTIWFGSNTHHLEQVITGLADQIYKTDINKLDTLLSESRSESSILSYTNDCLIKTTGTRRNFLTASIDCKNRQRTEENNFDLGGTLKFNLDNQSVSGTFNFIKRAGEFIIHDVRFDNIGLNPLANTISATFPVRHKKSSLTVRLPSGNAIDTFNLELKTNLINKQTKTLRADLSFLSIDDFAVIDEAVKQMESQHLNGTAPIFSTQPFSAHRLMTHLLKAMNITPVPVYCCKQTPLTLIKKHSENNTNSNNYTDLNKASTDELFLAICGNCHRSDEAFPPNFLTGNAEQRQRNLKQCAPRIAYRLQMWKYHRQKRSKTPMPPIAPDFATIQNTSTPWHESAIFEKMKKYILALIDSTQPADVLLPELLKTPYEKLDQCSTAALSPHTAS